MKKYQNIEELKSAYFNGMVETGDTVVIKKDGYYTDHHYNPYEVILTVAETESQFFLENGERAEYFSPSEMNIFGAAQCGCWDEEWAEGERFELFEKDPRQVVVFRYGDTHPLGRCELAPYTTRSKSAEGNNEYVIVWKDGTRRTDYAEWARPCCCVKFPKEN